MFKRIVVAIDLSPQSDAAARYAASLGSHLGSDVLLLHVSEQEQFEYAMVSPVANAVATAAESQRERAGRRLAEFRETVLGGRYARCSVVEGEPADAILEFARAECADLIVMPTRGMNPVRRFLIGSVTSKVLRQSEIPVLTGVHLEREIVFPDFAIRRILCAVDMGPQTAAVLERSAGLAFELSADLRAIHVDEAYGRTGNAEMLGQFLRLSGFQGEAVVMHGDPEKAIAQMALDFGADLVVIGRGCSSDILGRLRAKAHGILRLSPCPVLSV